MIRVYKYIDSLVDFDREVGFWSGAKQVWEDLNDDQRAEAEQIFNDLFYEDESLSETEINDWVWFELPDLIR